MSDKHKILDNLRQIEALVAETKALLEKHEMDGAKVLESEPPTTPPTTPPGHGN